MWAPSALESPEVVFFKRQLPGQLPGPIPGPLNQTLQEPTFLVSYPGDPYAEAWRPLVSWTDIENDQKEHIMFWHGQFADAIVMKVGFFF